MVTGKHRPKGLEFQLGGGKVGGGRVCEGGLSVSNRGVGVWFIHKRCFHEQRRSNSQYDRIEGFTTARRWKLGPGIGVVWMEFM